MYEKYYISPEELILIITDIQEKLVKAMEKSIAELVIKNNKILIEQQKFLISRLL